MKIIPSGEVSSMTWNDPKLKKPENRTPVLIKYHLDFDPIYGPNGHNNVIFKACYDHNKTYWVDWCGDILENELVDGWIYREEI